MGKIKAYIVDNNVLNRHMITNTIKKEGDILAVLSSNCENQRSIISEIGNINPNVVLIGINSAESKNFQLFRSVRQKFKSLPVIVLIPKNPEGAIAGIQALKEGAVEIITLPENSSTILLAKDHLKKRLISFISSIPNINVDLLSGDKSKTDYQINPKLTVNRSVNPVDLVIIAGCTGGIRSLFSLIKELPSDLSVPVLVVQHLPYNFTGQLAEELNKISKLRVDEADHGDLIVPGRVLIAPGGYHINIKNDGTDETIALHRGPREQKCRPSIDVLIRSARYVYGGNLLTVFLSGGGRDGILGAENVYSLGGQVIVQDRDTSLLWDLPGEIVSYGLSDGEYPIELMGKEIVRRVLKSKDSKLYQQFRNRIPAPLTRADNFMQKEL